MIVVHHSATDIISAEQLRQSIKNHHKVNAVYHYIIDSKGGLFKEADFNAILGPTLNKEANQYGVHIVLIGNFNNAPPTQEQYDTLSYLIKELQKKIPTINVVTTHKDVGQTSCPGKLFDRTKLPLITQTFSLSRYYAPLSGQSRYYNGRTYEADVKMNCGGDCRYTATGHPTNHNDRAKTVACDKSMKGHQLYLEGIGTLTCNDVGGAITGNRIDMFCGVGEQALDERSTCPTGIRQGYRLN